MRTIMGLQQDIGSAPMWNSTARGATGSKMFFDYVDSVSVYERSDQEIARIAANALKWNLAVPENRVKATARDGVVTLIGDVDSTYQKTIAEHGVRYLIGETQVTNKIRIKSAVKPSTPQPSPRTQMAELKACARKIQRLIRGETL